MVFLVMLVQRLSKRLWMLDLLLQGLLRMPGTGSPGVMSQKMVAQSIPKHSKKSMCFRGWSTPISLCHLTLILVMLTL